MKTYAYTYRDKAGALKKSALQAPDRLDALRQIKAMGCVPISVTEGTAVSQKLQWTFSWRQTALLTAVCALAGIGFWFLPDRKHRTTAASAATAARTPKNARATKTVPSDMSAPSDTRIPKQPPAPAAIPTASPVQPVSPPPVVGPTVTAAPVTTAAPAADPATPKRPAPFTTTTEQLLAMITSIPPGIPMPPLPVPEGMENDYLLAKTNVLAIYDEDNEKTAESIEAVAWAKLDLDKLVNQGWKPDEILKELARRHNEEADLRSNFSTAIKKMVDAGKLSRPELTEELIQINSELAQRGLPEITLEELELDDE